MPEAKKCPFRVDENGDFKDCLGAECMAFYERTEKVFTPDPLNPCCYSVEKSVRKIRCLRCETPTGKLEEG